MRVLITGDRDWTDEHKIRAILTRIWQLFGANVIIVEGDARGADLKRSKGTKNMVSLLENYWGIPVLKIK